MRHLQRGLKPILTGSLGLYARELRSSNLHLINGLFDCQRNGVPVLAIAAHIPAARSGSIISRQHIRKTCRVAVLCRAGLRIPAASADIETRNPDCDRQAGCCGRCAARRRALMKIDDDVPEWIAPSAPDFGGQARPDIGHLVVFLNKASRVNLFCGAGAPARMRDHRTRPQTEGPDRALHFVGKEFVEYDNPMTWE